MQKRQILINAIMSVLQVIVTAGVLFTLYRFLLITIGVEQLGIWSIVLATTSVANITNLGLSGSVVKFVAKYLARGEEKTVAYVIQTSAISIGILIGSSLLIAYYFANWLLALIVPVANLKEAFSILPYALLSLWITVNAGIFQAGLDGYQRVDLRNMVLIAGSLLYLVLCFVLVPIYGLMGLAYSYVSQSCVVLIGSWLMLKFHLPMLPVIPYQWNVKLFKEMIGYGINFQITSISQMLYDPITKGLLTKFGGLAMTGFYEMASRMILQLRALIVTANQVLVPTIADLQEKNPEIIQKVYKNSYRLLLYFAFPIFSAIIAFTPIISQVWIGHYENIFVLFSTLLAIGWVLNTLNVPAYFANLGIGELRWNTISHVMIGVLNLGLGFMLGNIYGGTGVVVGWIFSLVIGSLLIPITYHSRYRIPIGELLPKEDIGIGFASIVGASISLLLYYQLSNKLILPSLTIAIIIAIVFSSILVIPVWRHPMRKRSMGWITHEFLR